MGSAKLVRTSSYRAFGKHWNNPNRKVLLMQTTNKYREPLQEQTPRHPAIHGIILSRSYFFFFKARRKGLCNSCQVCPELLSRSRISTEEVESGTDDEFVFLFLGWLYICIAAFCGFLTCYMVELLNMSIMSGLANSVDFTSVYTLRYLCIFTLLLAT